MHIDWLVSTQFESPSKEIIEQRRIQNQILYKTQKYNFTILVYKLYMKTNQNRIKLKKL